MNALSIITGLPISDERCVVVAQPNHPQGQRLPVSIIFELPRNQTNQPPITLGWTATHIIRDPIGESACLVAGPNGRFAKISADKHEEGAIDHSIQDGPDLHGEIRSFRRIKDDVYAVGMGRQVYRRVSGTAWQHIDRGTIDSMDNLEVSGFNDIDGVGPDLLYAVGFDGEIWKSDRGRWARIESPTNAALYTVKVLGGDDMDVVAAGQQGLIVRGSGSGWRVIDQNLTTEDFWNSAYFNDEIYLASKSSVFRLLKDDTLENVEMGGQQVTCKVLKCYENTLWSFGDSHILRTRDGETWDTQFSFKS